MKFLFINKPFLLEPLGIMYIASSIKEKGHEVDLITTSENLEKKLIEYKPDFVGYSIMTGDQNFYEGINKKLKEKHDFFSIAGGPHPTFFPELLGTSSFDALCMGESEEAIKQLLENPNSKSIPNFWFKTNEGIIRNPVQSLTEDLDTLPFPDRELVFKYDHINKGPIKHFIASRGCPYNCSFCFNESFSELYDGKGTRVRFRSLDNLLEEVKQVIFSSPTKVVCFQDDTFILKPKWIKEFSTKYKKRIDLPFYCHVRPNLVKEEIVDDLKNAGCYGVNIGVESGNDNVKKDVLSRKISNEQIYDAITLLKSNGIKVMAHNILGLPFTTLQNDFETLELNIRCQPNYAWASIFQPYPKTRLGEKCVEEGIYTGNFSDTNTFFDTSSLNIENKNEIANLQKLFAIAVKHPRLYSSGKLQKLIQIPYEKTRERFTRLYKNFRKRADKELYGVDF